MIETVKSSVKSPVKSIVESPVESLLSQAPVPARKVGTVHADDIHAPHGLTDMRKTGARKAVVA